MKVLSLLQPWASLVVEGHKKIETRSWNTKYRGELLIHASAKHIKLTNGMYPLIDNMQSIGFMEEYQNLPYGAIIGKVDLVATVEVEEFQISEYLSDGVTHWELTDKEKAFGDYSPNRYGWLLSNPVLFKEPIPAKGQLGIWNWNYNGDIDYKVNKCHPSLDDIINAKNLAFINNNTSPHPKQSL